MAYVNVPKHLSILDHGMPDHGKTVSRDYPWGDRLVISRVGGSYRDLAAQSTDFEWTLTRGESVKKGDFSAIGGLCGSFQDCYYPAVRRIEMKMLEAVQLKAIDTDDYFPPTWPVVVSDRHVVAVGDREYGCDFIWIDQPIEKPEAADVHTNVLVYVSVTKAFYDQCLSAAGVLTPA